MITFVIAALLRLGAYLVLFAEIHNAKGLLALLIPFFLAAGLAVAERFLP